MCSTYACNSASGAARCACLTVFAEAPVLRDAYQAFRNLRASAESWGSRPLAVTEKFAARRNGVPQELSPRSIVTQSLLATLRAADQQRDGRAIGSAGAQELHWGGTDAQRGSGPGNTFPSDSSILDCRRHRLSGSAHTTFRTVSSRSVVEDPPHHHRSGLCR